MLQLSCQVSGRTRLELRCRPQCPLLTSHQDLSIFCRTWKLSLKRLLQTTGLRSGPPATLSLSLLVPELSLVAPSVFQLEVSKPLPGLAGSATSVPVSQPVLWSLTWEDQESHPLSVLYPTAETSLMKEPFIGSVGLGLDLGPGLPHLARVTLLPD